MLKNHEMSKLKTEESNVEEWLCDECGRHLKFEFDPLKRSVLSKGDEYSTHTGSNLGGAVSITFQNGRPPLH